MEDVIVQLDIADFVPYFEQISSNQFVTIGVLIGIGLSIILAVFLDGI